MPTRSKCETTWREYGHGRRFLNWLKSLSLMRLITYVLSEVVLVHLSVGWGDAAQMNSTLHILLIVGMLIGWTVGLSPWATTPVREEVWTAPRLRVDDVLVEAAIVRPEGMEHTVLVLHPDGVYEEFSGPVWFGPDDYLTFP